MSPLDIIELPGQPGKHARRAFVEAWQAAGSPPVNSAGRLYADQKYFWDGWAARLPGFNPADNPDDESQRLAHVRFGAGDIDPTPDRVRRLEAAGLIRPYDYEPWHWELPDIRQYAIVRSIPTPPPPTPSEEDDMLTTFYATQSDGTAPDKGRVFMIFRDGRTGNLAKRHLKARPWAAIKEAHAAGGEKLPHITMTAKALNDIANAA
jgi:hypothetical protein